MTPEIFKKRLSVYGADLSRWPLADIKAAIALLGKNAELAQTFAVVERMDDALRHAAPGAAPVSRGLAEKITKRMRHIPQENRPAAPVFSRPRLSAAGLVLILVMGIASTFWGAGYSSLPVDYVSYQQQFVQDDFDGLG